MYARWLCLTSLFTALLTTLGLGLDYLLHPAPAARAEVTAAGSQLEQAPLQVLITGAVAQPGFYHLPAGSNLQALIQLAGGLTPEAQPEAGSLQRLLKAGEVITVPAHPAAASSAQQGLERAEKTDTPGQSSKKRKQKTHKKAKKAQKTGSKTAASLLKVNLNTATAQELERLDGVGPALAARIVAYRQQQPFQQPEDLLKVKGIGPKKLQKIRAQLAGF